MGGGESHGRKPAACLMHFAWRAIILHIIQRGGVEMAGSGKADKGRKQQKKKPQHTLKEKRKLKEEKKNKPTTGLG